MYEVLKTDEFDRWLSSLKDRVGKAKIISRIRPPRISQCR